MIRKGIKATMFRSVALFGLISAASMLTACGGGADSSTSAHSSTLQAAGLSTALWRGFDMFQGANPVTRMLTENSPMKQART